MERWKKTKEMGWMEVREDDRGVGGGGVERDGGKMRGVNRVGLSEKEGWRRRRKTGGAQFAITGATGQKVSKKGDECV